MKIFVLLSFIVIFCMIYAPAILCRAGADEMPRSKLIADTIKSFSPDSIITNKTPFYFILRCRHPYKIDTTKKDIWPSVEDVNVKEDEESEDTCSPPKLQEPICFILKDTTCTPVYFTLHCKQPGMKSARISFVPSIENVDVKEDEERDDTCIPPKLQALFHFDLKRGRSYKVGCSLKECEFNKREDEEKDTL